MGRGGAADEAIGFFPLLYGVSYLMSMHITSIHGNSRPCPFHSILTPRLCPIQFTHTRVVLVSRPSIEAVAIVPLPLLWVQSRVFISP